MKKFLSYFLVFVGLIVGSAGSSHAQSFNCNYAKTPDEVLICQNADLSALDEQMSAMFFRLRNSLYGGQLRLLEAEQSSWLRNRMACGRDADCIDTAYEWRIRQLRTY
jgi:uncharacterized protein